MRRVDDAGSDMLVTADHLGGCLSALVPLAVASQVSDRLIEQRERWGFSHSSVRADALGQLEPVVAALGGR